MRSTARRSLLAAPLAFVLATTSVAHGQSSSGSSTSGSSGTDWKLTAGLIALGVGAVLIPVSLIEFHAESNAQDDPTFNTYRTRFSVRDTSDVCTEAHNGNRGVITQGPPGEAEQVASFCDSVKRDKDLGWAFLIVGGVAVATGVTLLVLHSTSGKKATQTASIELAPRVGLHSASLSLVAQF